MKMIKAIIRPEKFGRVKDVLAEKGHIALTVSEVKGRGAQKGITLQYRGKKMEVDLIPKVCIDIALDDDDVADVIAIIKEQAQTGKNGDGKIFVMPLEEIIRVKD